MGLMSIVFVLVGTERTSGRQIEEGLLFTTVIIRSILNDFGEYKLEHPQSFVTKNCILFLFDIPKAQGIKKNCFPMNLVSNGSPWEGCRFVAP